MSERPGVSVCMIVKDEAVLLPDALASVAGWATEILVGDTGSTDETVAIAKAHGARVIHVPWTGDFAEARNTVQAEASQPWILTMDADHRLTPETKAWLDSHLADLPPDAYDGIIYWPGVGGGQTRVMFFPNHLGIRWGMPIHERPFWPDGKQIIGRPLPALQLLCADGARSPETQRAKQEGYLAQLQAALAETPGSHGLRHAMVLTLLQMERPDEAGEILLACWQEDPVRNGWDPGHVPWQLGVLASKRGEWAAASDWATKALAERADHLGAHQLLTESLHARAGIGATLEAARAWWAAAAADGARSSAEALQLPKEKAEAARHYVWALAHLDRWDEAWAVASHPAAPPDVRLHLHLSQGNVRAAIEAFCNEQPDPAKAMAFWHQELAASADTPGLVEAMIWGALAHPYYTKTAGEQFRLLADTYPQSALVGRRQEQFYEQRFGKRPAPGNATPQGSPR